MFLYCSKLGGLFHLPSGSFPPWCCRAMRPLGGRSGIVAPGRTVKPFSTTVTVLSFTVISNVFHSPTGLSAWWRGVTFSADDVGVDMRTASGRAVGAKVFGVGTVDVEGKWADLVDA